MIHRTRPQILDPDIEVLTPVDKQKNENKQKNPTMRLWHGLSDSFPCGKHLSM